MMNADMFRDAAASIRRWREFKRRTGEWPLASIVASLLQITVFIIGGAFLLVYGGRHGWSKDRFALVFILMLVPFVFLWGSLQDRIRLAEVRRAHARGRLTRKAAVELSLPGRSRR